MMDISRIVRKWAKANGVKQPKALVRKLEEANNREWHKYLHEFWAYFSGELDIQNIDKLIKWLEHRKKELEAK